MNYSSEYKVVWSHPSSMTREAPGRKYSVFELPGIAEICFCYYCLYFSASCHLHDGLILRTNIKAWYCLLPTLPLGHVHSYGSIEGEVCLIPLSTGTVILTGFYTGCAKRRTGVLHSSLPRCIPLKQQAESGPG